MLDRRTVPTPDAPVNSFKNGEPAFGPGRIGQAAQLDGTRFVEAGNVGDFGFYDKFSAGAWIRLDDSGGGLVLAR